MTAPSLLSTDRAAGVVQVTLNRPDRANAFDAAMIRELTDMAERLADRTDVRAVVLRGDGRNFCAGGDLTWMREQFEADDAHRRDQARKLAAMLAAWDELPFLVIAAVHGAIYGGGIGLAAVCDVVVAAQSARFALTETRLGLIPATIAPFVISKIGVGAMRRIGLHGQPFGAEEAVRIGLAAECVDDRGIEAAIAHHTELALACAPGAVAEAKRLYRTIAAGPVTADMTAEALASRWRSPEAQSGIAAFFRKEEPPWRRS
jgi:methylglutaconyl-CoA hydratase